MLSVQECTLAVGFMAAINELSILVRHVSVGMGIDNQNTRTLCAECCKSTLTKRATDRNFKVVVLRI